MPIKPQKYRVTARQLIDMHQVVEAANPEEAVAKALASPNFWYPHPHTVADTRRWEYLIEPLGSGV